ncbi:FHA domain-containing protein [Paraliomyxa miuraensis]|uniref:FHA domain-containing protein n=1 Tax=Paraliomyxa miuraensis TaxID=376150 RepID=UPI00225A3F5E|nr:FHA domain-containing protein [Paraliomyxa miuraensis]MCX4241172.1 FHA domain-containing protein [Paraliomyxa miuraensis]
MAVVESLFPAAMRLGRPSFIAEHQGFHLLKPPTAYDAASLGFTTLESDPNDPSQIIPSTQHWQAVKVAKRPGNPYPERMSVGRALNCDLVLRFPVVSKLHAHFLVGAGGQLSLVDLGSSNGTWRNGVRLQPGQAIPVGPRDLLSFGGVHCEVLDAGGLYELVSGERR